MDVANRSDFSPFEFSLIGKPPRWYSFLTGGFDMEFFCAGEKIYTIQGMRTSTSPLLPVSFTVLNDLSEPVGGGELLSDSSYGVELRDGSLERFRVSLRGVLEFESPNQLSAINLNQRDPKLFFDGWEIWPKQVRSSLRIQANSLGKTSLLLPVVASYLCKIFYNMKHSD